jgi:hypothetical protein
VDLPGLAPGGHPKCAGTNVLSRLAGPCVVCVLKVVDLLPGQRLEPY